MEKIQKRINALRNNQLEIDQAEVKLSEDIIQLECKHAAVFEALYKKREAIVNGEREPSEDESKWEFVSEEKEQNDKDKIDLTKPGVPDFWLKALESAKLTSGIINDDDRPILKHLKNITVKQKSEKPFGFTLEFHFETNEYFKNQVLTKTYEFTDEIDPRNPLLNSHNALHKCLGCEIEWNKGKSPIKETPLEEDEIGSFFDFFRSHTPDGIRPAMKKKPADKATTKNGNGHNAELDLDEQELEHLFELDHEIGKFIKDMIIPKAIMFYTGEIKELGFDEMDQDDFDEDDDDEDDDDDDDDDDDESDDEPGSKPTKKKVKTK